MAIVPEGSPAIKLSLRGALWTLVHILILLVVDVRALVLLLIVVLVSIGA
jgi:hypothetical protein